MSTKLRIGLISDTHNLVRPEATAFLRGCHHIIHAGDICNASTLDELSRIAPITAVRGNNDKGAWAEVLAVVNPGSAGPRRFSLPISIGEIIIDGSSVSARTVELVGQNAG